MLWKRYLRPKSIAEALDALTASRGRAALIAGGTDLMLDLQQGRRAAVETLVDITAIPELQRLEVREASLFVGAGVPLSRVAASREVQTHAQALAEAAGQMAGPQVRHVATLGGNVAHALPAADGAMALLALDARAEIASPAGRRESPLPALYRGPGQSALAPDELLVGFHLPLRQPGQASAFRRVMRPQGVALPILNAAVWLARAGAHIASARIVVAPFGPVPRRALAAESALCGQPLTPQAVDRALEALLAEARFRTSRYRATAEYRRHLAGILLREALHTAWERAAAQTGGPRSEKEE